MVDEPVPGHSGQQTPKSGQKRKYQYQPPLTEQDLEKLLYDSDCDIDDPTSLSEEERKAGWLNFSDEDEEEVNVEEDIEDLDLTLLASEMDQSLEDDVPLAQFQTKQMKQSKENTGQTRNSPIVTSWSSDPPAVPQQIAFVKQRQLLVLPNGNNPRLLGAAGGRQFL